MKKLERQRKIDGDKKTYNFLVIEEAGESERIELAEHHPGEPDNIMSINISNTALSPEECDYLMDLNVDDEVRLLIGQSMYRNKQRNIGRDEVIKEVRDMHESAGNSVN